MAPCSIIIISLTTPTPVTRSLSLTTLVLLKLRTTFSTTFKTSYIDAYGSLKVSKKMARIITAVRQGMVSGLKPKLTDEGTCGTYMMRSKHQETIAIYKPIDEEPFAPNNPRGYVGDFGNATCRPGVLSGEATIREVAVFFLDSTGFHRVPHTAFIEVIHPSLKSVVLTGLEVTSESYKSILAALIAPS